MPSIDSKEAPTTSRVSEGSLVRDEGREDIKSTFSRLNSCCSISQRTFILGGKLISLEGISGPYHHIPIPQDDPSIISAEFSLIKFDSAKSIPKILESEPSSHTENFESRQHYFPSLSSSKGAYILFEDTFPPLLTFVFTSSSGMKTTKIFNFSKAKSNPHHRSNWYFLPIKLPDISSFYIEIIKNEGKGFIINSLVFIRGMEYSEETTPCKSKERSYLGKLCSSEATLMKAVFVTEGNRYDPPIFHDDPTIVCPAYDMVKAIKETDDLYRKDLEKCDQSSEAQSMLKGDWFVSLSHLSIPFPSPCPIYGAYICIRKHSSSPQLLFTFTDCDGKKTSNWYEFTEPKREYEWYFLPIDLISVNLCEIEGKGTWKEKDSHIFEIECLHFVREETIEESHIRHVYETHWAETSVLNTTFMNPGDVSFIPIPRDDSAVIKPRYDRVFGINSSCKKESKHYDQSSRALKMLKGEDYVRLSHLSIPFLSTLESSPSNFKCAYICINKNDMIPSLLFTFTLSDGIKISKRYEFTELKYEYEWHFLPIDLSNVILCEIQGKGMWEKKRKNSPYFRLYSLIFLKRHIYVRKPEFIQNGDYSCIPIPRDAPSIINPAFERIMAKNERYVEGSRGYTQSSQAQKMIKGEKTAGKFTSISIPFSPPSDIKGAYICCTPKAISSSLSELTSSSSFNPPIQLIFTFSSSRGIIQSIKYEFPDLAINSWFFLPIDLPDVVLCEIEGKSKQDRFDFSVKSLAFTRNETAEEIIARQSTEVLASKMWHEANVPENGHHILLSLEEGISWPKPCSPLRDHSLGVTNNYYLSKQHSLTRL
ncbi:hypothetical protein ADUPG1_008918 [Aduncisulcus paluster]|uniref:Uncharacterized protein n=1 Tax=Aduncisulcus paluster TaxID=2918883 RepID=A0ABQ5KTR2_9EUKA|nr:hypothetical protein ADUPG1_008918 [Aduncisulcus paluster]